MWRAARGLALCVLVLVCLPLLRWPALGAELDFPALSGRVVDAAGILGPEARTKLEGKLRAYEDKTSDQVVVATVPGLQGTTIEDYANRLFRHWQLGQKKSNNGVLLVVAPNERKVRIEVGYGLEGALTDALSKVIITTAMAPRFKAGDFAGGIEAGVDAVLSILSGDAEEWHRRAEVRGDETSPVEIVMFVVILLVIILLVSRMGRGRRGGFIIVPGPAPGGFGGGWSGGVSGGPSGGGFSGGGGSSGGGGASGDW